jgi:hypothetical protein
MNEILLLRHSDILGDHMSHSSFSVHLHPRFRLLHFKVVDSCKVTGVLCACVSSWFRYLLKITSQCFYDILLAVIHNALFMLTWI